MDSLRLRLSVCLPVCMPVCLSVALSLSRIALMTGGMGLGMGRVCESVPSSLSVVYSGTPVSSTSH